MNGYERIQAALLGKPIDSIPVMLHNFQMAAYEIGVTMEKFREDPDVMATAFIRSVEKYELDGIMIDMDTVTLAGAIGVPVDYPVNEAARTQRGRLNDLKDIRKLNQPDIENFKYVQNWLEAVRRIKKYFKNEVFVRGNCDQLPFSLASMLRGLENWMTDLYLEDEDLIFEVLNYCEKTTLQFIRLMSQTGCDMLSNGDSPAGPDLLPPDLYKKYAFPYEKNITEESHRLGFPYCLHICGNTELILEKMVETGADALELDYKTDTKKTYDLLHDKTTLIGNIDPSGVLAMGTEATVKTKTLELLSVFSTTNRFILNAGCAIPATTPEENIRMMIDTAREYVKAES
jgi:uroporphyrinogen decarboxylase